MNKSHLLSMVYGKTFTIVRFLRISLVFAYVLVFVVPPTVHAQVLPVPGVASPAGILLSGMVDHPVRLKGLKVFANEPFKFDVLVDKGHSDLSNEALKNDITRLSKYFLACLAIPESDLWVNLSPYEKDRIMPEVFGTTQMGKDLLEQDYALKRMSSVITYPETPLGAQFWKKVYEKVYAAYGTTDIPAVTFNKVWILPKSGEVFVRDQSAFVVKSSLDVMLDVDYQALSHQVSAERKEQYVRIYTETFQEIILPELRRQVNETHEFAIVRQVYDALILATWYKKNLQSGILSKLYVGANKVSGIDVADKTIPQQIYAQYLEAAKQGAYSYIKEEFDPASQALIARKYFSGGVQMDGFSSQFYREVAHPDEAMATLPLVRAPVYLERAGKIDMAQGMGLKSPLLRRMSVAALLALTLGGGFFAPLAQAATFNYSPDGQSVVATVEKGDTAGGILEQLRIKAKSESPLEYGQSKLSGDFGYLLQHVFGGQEIDHIHPGDHLRIDAGNYPQAAMDQLPHVVSSSVAGPQDQPLPDIEPLPNDHSLIPDPLTDPGLKDKKLMTNWPSYRDWVYGAAKELMEKGREKLPQVEVPAIDWKNKFGDLNTVVNSFSLNGIHLPDVKFSGFDAKSLALGLEVGGVLAALGLTAFGFAAYKKHRKAGDKKEGDGKATALTPVVLVDDKTEAERPITERVEVMRHALDERKAALDENGPKGHQVIDARLETMKQMLAAAERRTEEAGAETPVQSGKGSVTQKSVAVIGQKAYALQMLGQALTAVVALGLFMGGHYDMGAIILETFFLTRPMYALQVWWHEFGHKLAGAIKTGDWKAFFKANKLANLDKSSRRRLANPFVSMEGIDPHVIIPLDEDSPFVRLSGIGLTALTGLGGLAVIWISGGFYLLAPFLASTVMVLSAQREDLYGSEETARGVFRCGISGLYRFVIGQRSAKEVKQDLIDLLEWHRKMFKVLEDRGGQQMGIFTFLWSKVTGKPVKVGTKTLKAKRGLGWEDGTLVFYSHTITKMVKAAVRNIPGHAVMIDNDGNVQLFGWSGHVRFATGGDIVENAAHPHSSHWEFKTLHLFGADGAFLRAKKWVSVLIGHNGDFDAVVMGYLHGLAKNGRSLGYAAMRRLLPALIHNYYEGEVTAAYLKGFIDPLMGKLYKNGHPRIKYSEVLKELKRSGYVDKRGRVVRTFTGVDDNFKARFPRFEPNEKAKGSFALIESALFDLPTGDSPLVPLLIHLLLTQGNWAAAARYAHVMGALERESDMTNSVLSEKDETIVGGVFDEEFDKIKELLKLNEFTPEHRIKSLSDLWFATHGEAEEAGVPQQFEMLQIFKQMIALRMEEEIRLNSEAGKIFARWEEGWASVDAPESDVDGRRRQFIHVMTEKFFIGSREQATREFAARAEGTFGVFVRTPHNENGVTMYSDQQDVTFGLNRDTGYISHQSDPRVLKTIGPKEEKLTDIIYMADREVMNATQTLDGELELQAWSVPAHSEPREIPWDVLERRFHPYAEFVDGERNRFYSPPPFEYKKRRLMVQEEINKTAQVIREADQSWAEDSINWRSAANLVRTIVELKNKIQGDGRRRSVRLLVVGYDNSRAIPLLLAPMMQALIKGLKVEVVGANKFAKRPRDFHVDDGRTIALIVSKSGATFPTKTAAKGLVKLLGKEKVFGMTGRMDSVLNTALGQGLNPEYDDLTDRIFITGEFYSSEAPVLSELLLLYQYIRMVLQVTRGLLETKNSPFTVKISPKRLDVLSGKVKDGMLEFARSTSGVDENGKAYQTETGKYVKTLGNTFGVNFLRPWIVNRVMDVVIYSVFLFNTTLTAALAFTLIPLGLVPAGLVIFTGATSDFFLFRYGLPFWLSEKIAKHFGLPENGRMGARKLIIAAPEGLGQTMRNFVSRLFNNGLATTSPAITLTDDPEGELVSNLGSDAARGDLFLNVALKHTKADGQMSVNQLTFLKTGAFLGLNIFKGRSEEIELPIEVPQGENELETMIIDSTLGNFGMMMAVKVIGVRMAMIASFFGRLWNPGETTSRAGVHTTPTPHGVTDQMKKILEEPGVDERAALAEVVDQAQGANGRVMANDPAEVAVLKGGIDMDGRKIDLVEAGTIDVNLGADTVTPVRPFEGFTPRIGAIIPVLPGTALVL